MERTSRAQPTESIAVGEPRRAVAYALVLLLTAIAAGAALLASGEVLPPLGALLLLLVVAALCVNCFVLFPTEHASTAEAAVLLAAVVAFRDVSPYVGPLVLALLVGLLDIVHWERRAFVRMTYNAGNRGLATLVAAATCAAARAALGAAPREWFIVIVVTGAAFALVDLLLSSGLLACFGVRLGDAVRHVLDVDALTLPIAWYGATAALVLSGAGWWAIALALVPVAFVPEMVIARARRDVALVRDLSALVAVAAVLGLAATGLAVPSASTTVALVVIGVLVGVEVVLDRRSRVPLVVAVAMAGVCVAVDGTHVEFATVLVATAAVTASWCAAVRARRPNLLVLVTTAMLAAVGAAQLTRLAPSSVAGVTVGALGAGLAFGAIAVAVAADRSRAGAVAVWTVPLVLAGVAWGWTWRTGSGAAFVVAVVATLAGVVWWGAPPWRSRFLRAATARLPAGALPSLVVVVALAAIAGAALGNVWIAVGSGESLVAMVAIGVRQWRFAPRARARDLATLLLVGTTILVGEPALLDAHRPLGVVALVLLLGVVGLIARQPVSRTKAVERR